MNFQDLYNERKKSLNIIMEQYKNNINRDNIINKIKATITELNEKREEEIKRLCNDLHYQNRYQGTVLSMNGGIEKDFNKSIEYETLLLSILDMI